MRIVAYNPNPNPTIHIWTRNENGARIQKDITDFKPYFYIRQEQGVPSDPYIAYCDDIDKVVSLEGKLLKKLVLHDPKNVPTVRKYYDYTWEADIPFVDRYRLDNPEYEKNTPRILFLDIETLDLNVLSDNPIISIGLYDSFSEEYINLIWREDLNPDWEFGNNWTTKFFNKEYDMLAEFVSLVQDLDPDILSGWFSEGFDLPYIFNRLKKNKIDSANLSPIHYVEEKNIRIKGRVHLDLFRAYKKVRGSGMDTYRLGEIAQHELGYGKTENPGELTEIWKTDLKRLVKYNMNDVKLMVELDKKLSIINFFDMLCNEVNIGMEDAFFNGKIVDMYMLRTAKELGVVLPTKIRNPDESGPIQGAMVFEPEPGLHHNVAIFDLKSLYPSIMVSFNMSPETVIEKYKFKQDVMGIMPYALRHLFKQREELKKQGSQKRQRVVKEIMNTFYGATLFRGFRLQNKAMGESITGYGRKILQWTKDIVEENGFDVVYGDTDSVFVKNITSEEALELLDTINLSYDKFAKENGIKDHIFKIELEEICETAFFIKGRKRYALKTKDGIQVKGFEVRRSNNPRYARDVQRNLIKMILDGNSRKEIRQFLYDAKQQVRKLSLEDIGVPASINKPINQYKVLTMSLRAARWSNKHLRTDFGHGSKFLIIFVKRVPKEYTGTNGEDDTDIVAIDFGETLSRRFEIDYEEHTKRCVDSMTKSIEKGFNLHEKESSLDKFMKGFAK